MTLATARVCPSEASRAERLKDKRRRRAPVDNGLDVARELACLPNGVLRQRGIGTAIRSRDGRAVAERPHVRMTAAPHRLVDRDPATLIAHDGNGTRDRARHDARGEHDRAGVDGLVRQMHAAWLDRAHRRRHTDVGAPLLQYAHRDGPQLRVDLGQDACAGLEQEKPHLLTPDARIEAQHVVRERAQLAEQLDADESAADDDDREAAARVAETADTSASSSCSITWFLSTIASAIVLNVNAWCEPGIS